MIPIGFKEEDFFYNKLTPDQIYSFYDEFSELLDDFSRTVDQDAEIEAVLPVITRICIRIDQRKDYYMYYHSENGRVMHMSHEKEMALWAYWVCKYKPIRFKNEIDEEIFFQQNGCTVSDAFASYIIISTVCANNDDRVSYFTSEIVEGLYYDLSNRDFSKEAIIDRVSDLIN